MSFACGCAGVVKRGVAGVFAAGALAATLSAEAAPVTVQNHGFENPYITSPTTATPGWTHVSFASAYGYFYTCSVDLNSWPAPKEGRNFLFVAGYGSSAGTAVGVFQQIADRSLTAGEIYTLTVAAAQDRWHGSGSAMSLQFLVDGTVVASRNFTLPNTQMADYTLSYTVPVTAEGKGLMIGLATPASTKFGYVDTGFVADDVRLDVVPEPTAIAGLVTSGWLLLRRCRERRLQAACA